MARRKQEPNRVDELLELKIHQNRAIVMTLRSAKSSTPNILPVWLGIDAR
jgi:hypothetical protein